MLDHMELYRKILDEKEALLRGWIVYMVLSNGGTKGLEREFLHQYFGEWLWRTPEIVKDGDKWMLKC